MNSFEAQAENRKEIYLFITNDKMSRFNGVMSRDDRADVYPYSPLSEEKWNVLPIFVGTQHK